MVIMLKVKWNKLADLYHRPCKYHANETPIEHYDFHHGNEQSVIRNQFV